MSGGKILQLLHLEDDPNDAELVERELRRQEVPCEIRVATSRSEFLEGLETPGLDAILSDNHTLTIEGLEALRIARERHPDVPFVFVSGHLGDERNVARLKAEGAADCVLKSDLAKLPVVIRQALQREEPATRRPTPRVHSTGFERLVTVVQELSLARDLPAVMAIVRRAARELTGADGATFILRDGDLCYYADEDAIAPLWKGRRFPMTACISGWAMIHRAQVVIEDIYADSRIPHEAYRPTFVQSLVMVPIRTIDPIGAIGNYWAKRRHPDPEEVRLLQALADTTAVALENVQVYADLEQRVRDRTADLEEANRELEAFSSAVSHDLRAPLRHIQGYVRMLFDDSAEGLNEKGKQHITRLQEATRRMGNLIEDLLALSRTTQTPIHRKTVDLSAVALEIIADLQALAPERRVTVQVEEKISVQADEGLLRAALENLLSNAWKFTSARPEARVEVGTIKLGNGETAYYVRDDGAGFDMANASQLFGVFRRLHSQREFPGTGVGLATVQRIIRKHGGRIWAESAVNEGATFYFTLG